MPPIMNLRAARKSLFHNTSNFMQTLRGTPPRREGQTRAQVLRGLIRGGGLGSWEEPRPLGPHT